MSEYCVKIWEYQLECDKPLHRGWRVKMATFSVTYFLNDPIVKS